MRGPEGRAVAEACHELVTDGVPMQTLSTALGRAATWVHWIFDIHDLRPATRATQSTARRTRPLYDTTPSVGRSRTSWTPPTIPHPRAVPLSRAPPCGAYPRFVDTRVVYAASASLSV